MPAVDLVSYRPTRLVTDVTGQSAYVLARAVGSLLSAGDLLYVSTDGGGTWTPKPIDPTGSVITQSVDLAVDPLTGSDVFVATPYAVLQSADHGGTWTYDSPAPTAQISMIAVTHRPGRSRQVAVAHDFEPLMHLRTSTGRWTTVNTPGIVSSVVGGRTTRQAAITTPSGVYELDFAALRWLPMHGRTPALDRLETDFTTAPNIYACECGGDADAIWSRAPRPADDRPEPPDRGVDPDEGFPGYYGCAADKRQHEPVPAFAPSTVDPPAEVSLPLGASRTVPVTFRVRPRELDLFYLLDTGAQSYFFGCAAQQGAVWSSETLAATRNVRAGVGDYRDYMQATLLGIGGVTCLYTNVANEYVYRRGIRVGAVDEAFRAAVSSVNGGCNDDNGGLTGLYQAVTGAGLDVAPPGQSPSDIREGQEAGFARDAYKVIVHVGGGYLAERSLTRPGPTLPETVAALRAADVKQVGVFAAAPRKKKHHAEPEPEPPNADGMRMVADATGAHASRPVHCGKLAQSNLGVGDPLVCMYVHDERAAKQTEPPMGRQIVDLVSALTDPRPMRVDVVRGDARLRPRGKGPGTYDHLLAQTLTYDVTFRCTPADAGVLKTVELAGLVGGDAVATARTSVRCAAPPVPPKPVLIDAAPPVQLAGGAAIGNTLPNLQPQTQPANQTQANPQQLAQMAGAAVEQQQEQPRLAYADASPPETDGELAMSALPPSREEDVPVWAFVNAVAITSAAAAVALRQRTRQREARN
jgi:hypothetical protein